MGTYMKGIDEGGVTGGQDGHPEGKIARRCISVTNANSYLKDNSSMPRYL